MWVRTKIEQMIEFTPTIASLTNDRADRPLSVDPHCHRATSDQVACRRMTAK